MIQESDGISNDAFGLIFLFKINSIFLFCSVTIAFSEKLVLTKWYFFGSNYLTHKPENHL